MKKFISFIIIAILLIQMYLPVLSFATNDKVALDNHIIKALNEGNYDKDEDGEFTIEELSKVYWLYIDCDDEFVDLTGIENMTNLSTIGFNSATSDMDFTVLSQLPLDTLFLSGFLNDISFLQNLNSLSELSISFYNEDVPLDILSTLTTLQSLRISCNGDIDIDKLNNLTELKYLTIQVRDGVEVTPELIENINSLKVKNFALEGKVIYNVGNLVSNKQAEIPFDNIPLIKEMQNPGSKLYYEDFTYSKKDDLITVDNANKKFLLNLKNDDTRSATIEFDNDITLEIQWSTAEDDEEPELSDKIKNALQKVGVDKDNNGKYTISELKNVHSLDLNFSYNDKFDLTGIEKITNLEGLTITATCPEVDLSLLKELPNLTYLSLNGNFNSMDSLEGVTNLVSLRISTYNKDFYFNFGIINRMTNLEALDIYGINENNLNNINKLTNLNKLKRLTLNFGTEPNELKLPNLTNLEELNLSYIKTDNLKDLEKLTKLRKLYIQPVLNKDNSDVDTEAIKKLTNLEQLKITLTDDPSWVNSLSKLKQVVLVANTTEDNYENPQKIQQMVNGINTIKANVKLIGQFNFNIGKLTVGEERDINIGDNILVREFKDPNSKLYSPNININVGHNNFINEWNYNEKTKIAHLKVTEFGNDYAYASASEYEEDGMSVSINFKWKGIIDDDKETEIPINDENLKKALLEKYDIDGNKKITKHDLLNIDELDLDNKGIEDITILASMPNLERIILPNNKIKNIKVIEELSNSRKIQYINLKNNEIEDIQQIKDANFEIINLSENYIDFSENSANRKIIVDFGIERWGNEYDFYSQYMPLNQTREEFINENIDNYFKTYAANQKTKTTYKKGDVNGNGTVDLTDYSMILKHVKGIKLLEGEQLERADVNQNGNIDLTDYSMVLKHVKGIKLLF